MHERDDDVDELAGQIRELDELLHGERSKSDSGLVGKIDKMETQLNSLLRVIYQADYSGKGGLINEFHDLQRKVLGKEVSSEYHWKYGTAILIALITSIGAFLMQEFRPSLLAAWNKPPKSTTGKMIYKAKHPRIKKYKVRVVPAPKPPPPPPEDNHYGSF